MGQLVSKKQSQEAKHHSTPVGLYPTCEWDSRTIKGLVVRKKLAPIYKGQEGASSKGDSEECPICMLFYPCLNRALCCRKQICTECYLQIKKPRETGEASACPYCMAPDLEIVYAGRRSPQTVKEEREEQDRVTRLERQATARRGTEAEWPPQKEIASASKREPAEGTPEDGSDLPESPLAASGGGVAIPAAAGGGDGELSSAPAAVGVHGAAAPDAGADASAEGGAYGEGPSQPSEAPPMSHEDMVEQMLIMEAIRMSLADAGGQQ
mmetsp:Transcript_579/g.1556  ORF Transcript_579/g.1556 Transcript_579/m.1556 type:complete len:267 (+) Transcript_579:241-1041(+)|eukprot:CAMPEP_0119126290 /NCGR_PEP_ID=MMETSP1310-20130426/5273_1 /TAXON_ID=464262 /ORGANISM="Genus nov. species nov., Strain RCC2339" /LENGTH=266 /DNA_ID=CAMNT_0007116443 /DNA_START=172 /DNA_END=972 /DNA_ORIENTATION=+